VLYAEREHIRTSGKLLRHGWNMLAHAFDQCPSKEGVKDTHGVLYWHHRILLRQVCLIVTDMERRHRFQWCCPYPVSKFLYEEH
jgi:hypothetical protein